MVNGARQFISKLRGAGHVAMQTYRAVRSFRAELATFRPHRGPVSSAREVRHHPELREVSFQTIDALTIRGWYLPGTNRAAVIFSHGSLGDRRTLWPEASALANAGYGVLLFDWPGHGESDGVVRWGWAEQGALGAAIDFLHGRPELDPARIGALGFSMGGYLTAQVAAKDQRLRAVVLIGTPADGAEQTRHVHRAGGPWAEVAALWAVRHAGMDLRVERPLDVVAAIAPRPLFIINGTDDTIVPPAMARQLFEAAGDPRTLWLIEGAGHADLPRVAADYHRRLRGFFDGSLLAGPGSPAKSR
jgi:uncharacterized protein